jgi:cell wall-associated NlpC family hydrolase
MTPDDIIAAARAAIGTPFRHQGRIVGRGLDCAGLLAHVARTAGFDPVEVRGYPRRPNGELESALERQPFLTRVSGKPEAGDFLLMRFEDDRHFGHLAICAGDTIIHASAHSRKVCEHGFAP